MTDSNAEEVFLLGSGFSKAINDEMPSLTDLSERVWETFKKEDQKAKKHQLKHLKEQGLEHYKNNIELLLTYLSTSSPWLSQSEVLRNKASFNDLSKKMKAIISQKESKIFLDDDQNHISFPEFLEKLVRYWHQENSQIVTLNYDTIVERGFSKYDFTDDEDNNSTPHTLYPYPLTSLKSYRSGSRLSEMGVPPYEESTFRLFKLHGSTNYFYSGLDDYSGDEIFYLDPKGIKSQHSSHEREDLIRDKVPFIVPPVMEKSKFYSFISLIEIWKGAHKVIDKAKRIYIIGYSLPETDLTLRFFLSSKPEEQREIYLINKDHKNDPDKMSKKELEEHYNSILDDEINSHYVLSNKPVESFSDDLQAGKI